MIATQEGLVWLVGGMGHKSAHRSVWQGFSMDLLLSLGCIINYTLVNLTPVATLFFYLVGLSRWTQCNHRCSYKCKRGRKKRTRKIVSWGTWQAIGSLEDGKRSSGQRMTAASKGWRGEENWFSSRFSRRTQHCQHIDSNPVDPFQTFDLWNYKS